jgi:hypothetical protein
MPNSEEPYSIISRRPLSAVIPHGSLAFTRCAIFSAKYKCENAAKAALGISKNKWKYFGKLLNENDLRHAEITGSVPSVSHEEIDKLYRLAHRWAASYLRKAKSLPALG